MTTSTVDKNTELISYLLPFVENTDSALYWYTQEDSLHFSLDCSDFFMWGCADSQEVTTENLPVLKKAYEDANAVGARSWAWALFVCRVQNMRPQGAFYKLIPSTLVPLINETGEERTPQMGDPLAATEGKVQEPEPAKNILPLNAQSCELATKVFSTTDSNFTEDLGWQCDREGNVTFTVDVTGFFKKEEDLEPLLEEDLDLLKQAQIDGREAGDIHGFLFGALFVGRKRNTVPDLSGYDWYKNLDQNVFAVDNKKAVSVKRFSSENATKKNDFQR